MAVANAFETSSLRSVSIDDSDAYQKIIIGIIGELINWALLEQLRWKS